MQEDNKVNETLATTINQKFNYMRKEVEYLHHQIEYHYYLKEKIRSQIETIDAQIERLNLNLKKMNSRLKTLRRCHSLYQRNENYSYSHQHLFPNYSSISHVELSHYLPIDYMGNTVTRDSFHRQMEQLNDNIHLVKLEIQSRKAKKKAVKLYVENTLNDWIQEIKISRGSGASLQNQLIHCFEVFVKKKFMLENTRETRRNIRWFRLTNK